MNKNSAEWRMAENEMVFRQANEKARKRLLDLKDSLESSGEADLLPDIDAPIYFYCECSDENCRERILLKPSKFKQLHQNSSQFLILPGHNVASIERQIRVTDDYVVVEKFMTPPPNPTGLNVTPVRNT